LDVHHINDVRQIEKHTAEPTEPESRCVKVETAIEELKNIYYWVLIKFWKRLSKQEVIHYILFGIGKTATAVE
jgi:hypothetical protein